MDDDEIQSEIAYLDDFADVALPGDMVALMQSMVQVSKQNWAQSEELCSRVESLESRIETMMRMMQMVASRSRRLPVVEYVVVQTKSTHQGTLNFGSAALGSAPQPKDSVAVPKAKFPRAMIVLYVLGLTCVVTFAALLALSAAGTTLLHPFLSLLGLVGGLGWLTTAWTDLLLWKHERVFGNQSTRKKTETASSQV